MPSRIDLRLLFRFGLCLLFRPLLCVGIAIGISAAEGVRPNVIFILADDLGWADLSCYGSRFHRTPNLDQLARDGMKFTQAYAACSVCSPTRASILTGKYPARLHLTDWLPGRPDMASQKLSRPTIRQQLPLEEITLAEALQSAGYITAHIGKWHLGGKGFEPTRQGFDLNMAGDEAGSPRSYFAPFQRNGRFMPGLENAPDGEYLTDRVTAEAEKFIEQNRARPFFLYLAHYAVHIPLKAKAEFVAHYSAAKGGFQTNAIYAAMLESVDEGIGRIMGKLKETGLSERTIVIFTSDNGGLATLEGPNTPATSNAPLREGKGYPYEGGIREPLLVSWPGVIKPGAVSMAPVCSIDFFPTLLELCGVAKPAPVDGVSFSTILRDPAAVLPERALFWHYPHYSNQGGKPNGAIRRGDWKLIEYFENERLELFHVSDDISESKNLALEKPEVAASLRTELANWRKAVGAQMPAANPGYRPPHENAGGSIALHARDAEVHGAQLRYEPIPRKNTLGFWVRAEDWASWEFETARPGRFEVELLHGCGNGSGGSEVKVAVADQELVFTVKETGGFQNFVRRSIGQIDLSKSGRYSISVRPIRKPGLAVMDLREITLKRL